MCVYKIKTITCIEVVKHNCIKNNQLKKLTKIMTLKHNYALKKMATNINTVFKSQHLD